MSSSVKCSTCVEETLREILKFQKEDERKCEEENHHHHDSHCKSGCNTAIQELLNPHMVKIKKRKKKIMPFILYTKDGCPFKGDGVTIFHCKCCKKDKFNCFSTFLFKIVDIEKNCAILELLTFKKDEECSCSGACNSATPCAQIDCENVEDLISTGVCIKTDLSCFCSISVLPPVSLSK